MGLGAHRHETDTEGQNADYPLLVSLGRVIGLLALRLLVACSGCCLSTWRFLLPPERERVIMTGTDPSHDIGRVPPSVGLVSARALRDDNWPRNRTELSELAGGKVYHLPSYVAAVHPTSRQLLAKNSGKRFPLKFLYELSWQLSQLGASDLEFLYELASKNRRAATWLDQKIKPGKDISGLQVAASSGRA